MSNVSDEYRQQAATCIALAERITNPRIKASMLAMSAAFEATLKQLGLKDRNDPASEMVARKIIELCQRGVRDSGELIALTKQHFTNS